MKKMLALKNELIKSQLFSSGMGSLLVKLGATFLGMASGIVLARVLGAEEYGYYSYAYALVTILAIPCETGLPIIAVRETVKSMARAQWSMMRGMWRFGNIVILLISLVIIILSFGYLEVASSLPVNLDTKTFSVGLFLMPVIALGNFRSGALRGIGSVVKGQLPEMIIRPAIMIFALMTASLTMNQKIDSLNAMEINLSAAIFAFLIGALILHREQPLAVKQSKKREYKIKEWSSSIIPLAAVAGIGAINSQCDIIVLGLFRSAEEVSSFKVATSAVILVGFVMQAANMVLNPAVARYHIEGKIERIGQISRLIARISFAFSVIVFVIFLFFGFDLLKLVFGQSYVAAYIPLLVLSVGALANVAFGSVGGVLSMTNNERVIMWATLWSAIVNLALNVILVPKFGSAGAATATSMSLILWNIFLWITVKSRLGINVSIFK